MTNKTLYEAIGDISDKKIEEAKQVRNVKQTIWFKWGAVAACLCIMVGAITTISHINKNHPDIQQQELQSEPHPGESQAFSNPGENLPNSQSEEPALSNKTTAKVSYGYEEGMGAATENILMSYTEEEMFSNENMYVFRGRVSKLTNIIIDFNGEKHGRCVATIMIDEVYQGDITAGQQIPMLLPCPIKEGIIFAEDTDLIANLEIGMEGIFMPLIYDEESYVEMHGAILMYKELADCGLGDGMRWAFLSTEQGVLFDRVAYAGAKNANHLDDIEAYVIEMLK